MTDEITTMSGIASSVHRTRGYSTLWPISPAELYALADLGMTIQQIAAYFDVAANSVSREIEKLGLSLPAASDWRRLARDRTHPRRGAGRLVGGLPLRGIL